MRVGLSSLLAGLCLLVLTSPAQARMERVCSVRHSTSTQLRCGRANLHHAVSMLRFLRMYPNAGTRHDRAILRRDAKWLRKYALLHISRAQARMRPAVSHLSGWRCITNGAYPGAPHEGNGVNGPYSGPLGMTNPWMGHSGDWVHMNPVSVYAIAERVAARYGFSYSFMKGQWPNTFPPCAGHF